MIKHITIISNGEIIPEIGDKGRPTRSSIFASYLSDNNYKVKFITNKFNHFEKKNRKKIKKQTNIEYILISSIGYNKNVSIRRVIDHIIISIKIFFHLLFTKNELIICSFPTLSNVIACHFVSIFKKLNLVIDVRDLWPEIFKTYFKKNFILDILIKINYRIRKKIFKKHNIVAISNSYANIIKKTVAKNIEIPIFPLGSITFKNPIKKSENKDVIFWFLGSMGKTYDLKHLIKTTNEIKSKNIKFIISGNGASFDEIKKMSKNKNVIFTGWCDLKKIKYYGHIADIGIMPYTNFSTQDLPNKIFDYFSFSLPVLTNINKGDCLKIIKEDKGWIYDSKKKDSLRNKILEISGNKAKIRYFSKNTKYYFDKNFSSLIIYRKFLNYLNRFIY